MLGWFLFLFKLGCCLRISSNRIIACRSLYNCLKYIFPIFKEKNHLHCYISNNNSGGDNSGYISFFIDLIFLKSLRVKDKTEARCASQKYLQQCIFRSFPYMMVAVPATIDESKQAKSCSLVRTTFHIFLFLWKLFPYPTFSITHWELDTSLTTASGLEELTLLHKWHRWPLLKVLTCFPNIYHCKQCFLIR